MLNPVVFQRDPTTVFLSRRIGYGTTLSTHQSLAQSCQNGSLIQVAKSYSMLAELPDNSPTPTSPSTLLGSFQVLSVCLCVTKFCMSHKGQLN